MPLDYGSLLLAFGLVGAGLSATLFAAWLSARTQGFLLTWAVGVLLLVGAVFLYNAYVRTPRIAFAMGAFGLLMLGLSVILGAAVQFRRGRLPVRRIAFAGVAALIVVLPPFALGYDGLATIAGNMVAAIFLLATARQYWKARGEAPLSVIALSTIYAVIGVSFGLCAAVLIADGNLTIGHAPENWAEDLSALVSIAGLSGVGALSLALNQARLARRHRHEAITDSLTGLLNRRALFEIHGDKLVAPHTAVIVFDLDQFKTINDRFGHAVGDEVLIRFAGTMRQFARATDTVVRLGGEEFAIVLPRATPEMARLLAEGIRTLFASELIATGRGEFRCTVSAGVAMAGPGRPSFEEVLRRADDALYLAKRQGRNRVGSAELKLAI
jgi:diguanylate cyclase (GGDEF)-like protein